MNIAEMDIDYYIEFYDELDKRIEIFLDNSPTILCGIELREIIRTFLFYRLNIESDNYRKQRKEGKSVKESMSRIVEYFENVYNSCEITDCEDELLDLKEHPWENFLSAYRHSILIYIFDEEQLKYLTDLLCKIDFPTLLLSEYDIPGETELSEYVTALTIDFSEYRIISNAYFENMYPLIFNYANTFEILFQLLDPSVVLCLGGFHYQEQLLGVIAKKNHILSCGIQQMFPLFMITGYRNFAFEYYFTWGEISSQLLKKYNADTNFISLGYMGKTDIIQYKKECVCFIVQYSLSLIDRDYFSRFLDLVSNSAQKYPEINFLVIEESTFRLDDFILRRWDNIPNIEFVTKRSLQDIFLKSKIVISCYSSRLMESISFGCIPLVFNLTTNFNYGVDFEKLGLGLISNGEDDFYRCLDLLLVNDFIINKYEWSTFSGFKAIDNTLQLIKRILCGLRLINY